MGSILGSWGTTKADNKDLWPSPTLHSPEYGNQFKWQFVDLTEECKNPGERTEPCPSTGPSVVS